MRIKALFSLAMLGIAALATLVAGALALEQHARSRKAAEAGLMTEVAASLLRLTERLVIERGNFVIRMNAAGAADGDTLARLAGIGRGTDASLAQAVDALRAGGMAAHLRGIEAIGAELAALRTEAVRAAAQPLDRRDPAIRARPQAAFDRMLGTVTAALEASHGAIAAADGGLGNLILAARVVWDLRDQGSRRIVPIATALNSGRALSAAELEAVAGASRAMELAWQRTKQLVALIGDSPRLAAAIAEVEARYFGEAERRTRELVEAGRAGAAYPMSSAQFTEFATPSLQILLKVRDAALEEAALSAAATHEAAVRNLLLVAAAGVMVAVLLALLGWLLVRRIVGPVVALTGVVGRLAEGDHGVAVPGRGRGDEIGRMAEAIEVLRRNALEASRGAEEAVRAQAAKAAQADALQALIRRFEAEVAEALAGVAGAAAPLDETADRLGRAAEAAKARAGAMAVSAGTAAGNAQTVAASAEELAASIAEVARQVAESARIAQRARADAQATDAAVAGLVEVAQRIGDVVGLISSIAGQTNLLALNATIEAARAGDAGKGFAVVAGEVKALAAQTGKATEQIGAQISAMQAETARAVEAIRGIGKTIDEMSTIATQVAATAEEQAVATQEIGRAVAEAAASTDQVTQQTAEVMEGAETTAAATAGLREASIGLSLQADGLRAKVDGFLREMRAA